MISYRQPSLPARNKRPSGVPSIATMHTLSEGTLNRGSGWRCISECVSVGEAVHVGVWCVCVWVWMVGGGRYQCSHNVVYVHIQDYMTARTILSLL